MDNERCNVVIREALGVGDRQAEDVLARNEISQLAQKWFLKVTERLDKLKALLPSTNWFDHCWR